MGLAGLSHLAFLKAVLVYRGSSIRADLPGFWGGVLPNGGGREVYFKKVAKNSGTAKCIRWYTKTCFGKL